jgi:hypothetical protein
MGRELAVLIVAAGGSVLALWLYVRLGDRRPRSLRRAVAHTLVAVVALEGVSPAIGIVFGEDPSHRSAIAALMGIFLPAMTYVFLASLYVIEQLQRRLYAG